MRPRTLITSLYNERKKSRQDELIYCLKNNIDNNYIDNICIVYDGFEENLDNPIYQFIIKNPNLDIELCNGKPKFSQLIQIANNRYLGHQILISNSDIHFDSSLEALSKIDFKQKVFCISRYNKKSNEKWSLIKLNSEVPNYFSFDTWIFSSPFKEDIELDFELGSMFCDSLFAKQLYANTQYQVLNPCLTIKTYHIQKDLSLSQIQSNTENKSENNEIWRKHYLKNMFSSPISGVIWSEQSKTSSFYSTEINWSSPYNIILLADNKVNQGILQQASKIAEYANKFLWVYFEDYSIKPKCNLIGNNVNHIDKLPENIEEYIKYDPHKSLNKFISDNHHNHIVINQNDIISQNPTEDNRHSLPSLYIHKYKTRKDLILWIENELDRLEDQYIYFSHQKANVNEETIEAFKKEPSFNAQLIICKSIIELNDGTIWQQATCQYLFDILKFWESNVIALSLENFIINIQDLKRFLDHRPLNDGFIFEYMLDTAKKGLVMKSDLVLSTYTKMNQLMAFKWFVAHKDLVAEYISLLPEQLQVKFSIHKQEALSQFNIFNIYESKLD